MLWSANKIAKNLELPSSTVRYWLTDQYKAFVPKTTGKKHTEDIKEMIALIAKDKTDGLGIEEVKEHLRSSGYEEVVDGEVPENKSLTTRQQNQEMSATLLQIVETQQMQINIQEKYLAELMKMTDFIIGNFSLTPGAIPKTKPVKKPAPKKKASTKKVSPARKRGVAKKKVATMKGAVPKKKRSWKFWRK